MQKTILPGKLNGKLRAIPSKSQAHRLLICAALSDNSSEIYCPVLSKDITATAECLRALGAKIDYSSGTFSVIPAGYIDYTERDNAANAASDYAELDCGESGSTLRFLLPVVCALGKKAHIKMHGRLPERPLSPLWEELCAHGSRLVKEGDTITVSGKLEPGSYSIAADISSQFISGLLFALPVLHESSTLQLTGKIESEGYISMTRRAQQVFSIAPVYEDKRFIIDKNQSYHSPGEVAVEGDWSNAAFWIAADSLGSSIEVTGLDTDSLQGDKAVTEAVDRIRKGDAVIDCSNIPDLVPILAVTASVSPGMTRFVNAGRLRIKESDRLKTVHAMLAALGGDCTETEDGLIIKGREQLTGGTVDGANDHRIVMSAAIAATVCRGPVNVLGVEAADKSYPDFWSDYASLGGCFNE